MINTKRTLNNMKDFCHDLFLLRPICWTSCPWSLTTFNTLFLVFGLMAHTCPLFASLNLYIYEPACALFLSLVIVVISAL